MSVKLMPCLFVVVGCCVMTVSKAYSDTTVLIPGSTGEENEQINDALTRPPAWHSNADVDELLVRLGKLLKRHPDNRAARIMHLRTLAGLGRIAEATVDADYLQGKWPVDYRSNEALATLYQITGMRDIELAAYEAMAAAKPDNDPLGQAIREPEAMLHARVQELQGDTSGARKTWKNLIVASAPGNLKVAYGYAEFLVRLGAYDAAADEYRGIMLMLQKLPNQMGFVSLIAEYRLRLASVLWASGKLADASSHADAALSAMEKWNDFLGNKSPLLPEAALMGYSLDALLNRTGTTRPAVGRLFAFAGPTAPSSQTEDLDHVAIAGLTGTTETAAAMDQVEARLKDAPFLDSGLWAETYLGLASGSYSARTIEHLPKGTIQRAIFDRYGRGTR